MVNGLVYVVGHWTPRAWMKGGKKYEPGDVGWG